MVPGTDEAPQPIETFISSLDGFCTVLKQLQCFVGRNMKKNVSLLIILEFDIQAWRDEHG